MVDLNVDKYLKISDKLFAKKLGRVDKMVGLTIESTGPDAAINDICNIYAKDDTERVIKAEVVGFRDKKLLLMPFESIEGISVGCLVENTGSHLTIPVGDEILGQVVDGLGRPLDGSKINGTKYMSVEAPPPDPLERKIICDVLPLGVKAVDGLITVGKGQRLGIFAGSGEIGRAHV